MEPRSGTSERSARRLVAGSRHGGLAWIGHVLYGTYALAVLALLMLVLLLLVFLTPRLEWRRWLTRTFARAWLALAGLRLRVAGLDTLPAGSCVLVANHSSYLDGVALKAALSGIDFDRIVHLGAQAGVRYSIDHPAEYARSNLVGHLNLLEVARHRP